MADGAAQDLAQIAEEQCPHLGVETIFVVAADGEYAEEVALDAGA